MCIIISTFIDNKPYLAKNRDRMYSPKLEVIRELINGIEVLYLRDDSTDWSEGLNEYGVGLLNTALMVGYDEKEKKIVKKRGKPSKDGIKIREVLGKKTIKESIETATKFNGGIKGHTFITTPNKVMSIEQTSKHNPNYSIIKETAVRTNHGFKYIDAGYTSGKDYLSSKIRKESAEKVMKKCGDSKRILSGMRKKFYEFKSPLNMCRDTDKMKTSSQILLMPNERQVEIVLIDRNIEEFLGVTNKLPKNYGEPKIKLKITKV